MRFIAYLTKGLNNIAEDEIAADISGVSIERTSDKYIVFEAQKSCIPDILELKTVDDAHMLLNFEEFEEMPETNDILRLLSDNDLEQARKVLEDFRSPDNVFSLTLSKYRNTKVDLDYLEQELSNYIQESVSADFVQNSHSNFDIRIHLEERNLMISVRLTEKPLYFRDYWKEGRKGSLKTSIAAALCSITDISKGDKLVDNFCGAGTILCESSLQGADVYGGDIDREAVRCTRKNLQKISKEALNQVKRLDATATDHPDNYFDIAISNLPWGHQVDINAVELYSEAIKEYSRILKSDGEIVILGNHSELAEKYLKKHFPEHDLEEIQLGFLGQTPTIIHGTLR